MDLCAEDDVSASADGYCCGADHAACPISRSSGLPVRVTPHPTLPTPLDTPVCWFGTGSKATLTMQWFRGKRCTQLR